MGMGKYDHLTPVCMNIDLDTLAETLVHENYGVHRMLSALIRARRADDKLMDKIASLLDEDTF